MKCIFAAICKIILVLTVLASVAAGIIYVLELMGKIDLFTSKKQAFLYKDAEVAEV